MSALKLNRQSVILLLLTSNLGLSILIVLINKWVYQEIGFPNLTLTLIHFLTTWLGLLIASKVFKLFVPKKLPLIKMLPLSACFCGYVVFTNLSLEYNTVGTYQISKTLTMPCIMIIQVVFYQKRFSKSVLLTLVPIIAGASMNSIFDLKFNYAGFAFAMIGVLVTSAYQVLIGVHQKNLSVDSIQLLYYQAPLSAAWLLLVIPFVEPPSSELFSRSWSSHDLLLVTVSSLTALFINITIYAIIGNTSAMTYNVTGQLKFGLTLIGGYLLFRDPIQVSQLVAILVTWAGVAAYTWVRLKEESSLRIPMTASIRRT
ncbi:Solute carrier family 35 member E3 [Halotydeus destructor]|nr:Solute carrier family 35 member E3 [Halotydeus destructor]